MTNIIPFLLVVFHLANIVNGLQSPSTQCIHTTFPLINLVCPTGLLVSSINFASYGNSYGFCPTSLSLGTCNSPYSTSVVSHLCLNQRVCSFSITNALFGGDPCPGTFKSIAVSLVCAYGTSSGFCVMSTFLYM